MLKELRERDRHAQQRLRSIPISRVKSDTYEEDHE
jgi:hypothetical protein